MSSIEGSKSLGYEGTRNTEKNFFAVTVSFIPGASGDSSHCLTVHVLTLSTCCSVVISRCQILHGNPDTPLVAEGEGAVPGQSSGRGCGEVTEDAVKIVSVLFSLRCAKFVGLAVGRHIRIHPPW